MDKFMRTIRKISLHSIAKYYNETFLYIVRTKLKSTLLINREDKLTTGL